MQADPALASWLIARRSRIEQGMATRLGAAAPAAGEPETEALRRFRTFAAASLQRGRTAAPALDGLRVSERRVTALLEAWTASAGEVAREEGDAVRRALSPLVEHFRVALRGTHGVRRARGAPRAGRRAVSAAIDRVADAFLAIDADDGRIVDANPAAGALLGVSRDALLGVDALSFVPRDSHEEWWSHLDAVAEGDDPRHFHASLRDAHAGPLRAHASISRFATRNRTLALVMLRPSAAWE